MSVSRSMGEQGWQEKVSHGCQRGRRARTFLRAVGAARRLGRAARGTGGSEAGGGCRRVSAAEPLPRPS